MRSDWVALSASALVIGVMALVLGSVLNPIQSGATLSESLQVAADEGPRWIAVAVLYFGASLSLVLGLPAILELLHHRGRVIGLIGTGVFALGIIGLAGFAMLLVFLHALVKADALKEGKVDDVSVDLGLGIFLYGWVGGFVLGVALIAVALLRSGRTHRWVPILMLLFVALIPFSNRMGAVVSALQVLLLAVSFTGIAVAATSPRPVWRRQQPV